MARKKKSDAVVTPDTTELAAIGGVLVVEEKTADPKTTIENAKRKPAKKLDKTAGEKIEIMPQTYIEDTFDISDPSTSETTIIENPVKEKTKRFITREKLLDNIQYKNKVARAIKTILFEKSFSHLLDMSNFSKLNRSFFIDDETDEVDMILSDVVDYFKKRLAKIELSYQNFKIINAYLESIKTLYNRFKNEEGAMKESLKHELETLIKLDGFVRRHMF